MRLFLDTNVLLDVLMSREPYVEHSAKVLSVCATGNAQGLFSALSACDMVYILRRTGLVEAVAKSRVMLLAGTIGMTDVDVSSVADALRGNGPDFEDAVQALCAKRADADLVITRDKTGFVGATIPALTPTEFLNMEIDGIATAT